MGPTGLLSIAQTQYLARETTVQRTAHVPDASSGGSKDLDKYVSNALKHFYYSKLPPRPINWLEPPPSFY